MAEFDNGICHFHLDATQAVKVHRVVVERHTWQKRSPVRRQQAKAPARRPRPPVREPMEEESDESDDLDTEPATSSSQPAVPTLTVPLRTPATARPAVPSLAIPARQAEAQSGPVTARSAVPSLAVPPREPAAPSRDSSGDGSITHRAAPPADRKADSSMRVRNVVSLQVAPVNAPAPAVPKLALAGPAQDTARVPGLAIPTSDTAEPPMTARGGPPSLALAAQSAPDQPYVEDDELYGQTESARKLQKLAHFRLQCSEIEPWLFIAGEAVATDLAMLQARGITDVLNCAATAIPSPHQALTYHKLPLADAPSEQIDRYFYSVLEMMEQVQQSGGKVLVHCHQGVSRSCSFVMAYIMWHRGLSYNQALQRVRDVRGICQPNNGFTCQLLEWQKRLDVDMTPRATAWSGYSRDRAARVYLVQPNPTADSLDSFTHAARLVGGFSFPEPLKQGVLRGERQLCSDTALVVHSSTGLYIWQAAECAEAVIRSAVRHASYLQRFEGAVQSVKRVQNSDGSPTAQTFWKEWEPLYKSLFC